MSENAKENRGLTHFDEMGRARMVDVGEKEVTKRVAVATGRVVMTETRNVCNELGINMVRAATVGTHPRFVTMIRELIVERMSPSSQRLALGTLGPSHDECPDDCCLYPRDMRSRKTTA